MPLCDVDRGVGHIRRHLQLDLPGLRHDLILLHARAGHRRFLRADAERVADVHRHGPARILRVEQRVERVAVTARDGAGGLLVHRAADLIGGVGVLRSAKADQAVGGRQIDLRAHLVDEIFQGDVVGLDVLLARSSRSVRSAERAPHRRFDVDRLGAKVGTVGRIEAHAPVRVLGAGDDQPLERELRGPHRRLPRRPDSAAAVAACDCAWTTSIGAIVPTSTRVWLSLTSCVARVDRLLRDVDRLHREHVVPVGVADVREGVGDRGAQLESEMSRLILVTCSGGASSRS